jgi:hypothetical protein
MLVGTSESECSGISAGAASLSAEMPARGLVVSGLMAVGASDFTHAATSFFDARSTARSSASAIASALAKRSFASRESVFMTIASSSGAMPSMRALGGAITSSRTLRAMIVSLGPSKRRLPTSISQSTTPAA